MQAGDRVKLKTARQLENMYGENWDEQHYGIVGSMYDLLGTWVVIRSVDVEMIDIHGNDCSWHIEWFCDSDLYNRVEKALTSNMFDRAQHKELLKELKEAL